MLVPVFIWYSAPWAQQSSQFPTHIIVHSSSPYLTNLAIWRLWRLSKALLKSRYVAYLSLIHRHQSPHHRKQSGWSGMVCPWKIHVGCLQSPYPSYDWKRFLRAFGPSPSQGLRWGWLAHSSRIFIDENWSKKGIEDLRLCPVTCLSLLRLPLAASVLCLTFLAAFSPEEFFNPAFLHNDWSPNLFYPMRYSQRRNTRTKHKRIANLLKDIMNPTWECLGFSAQMIAP